MHILQFPHVLFKILDSVIVIIKILRVTVQSCAKAAAAKPELRILRIFLCTCR